MSLAIITDPAPAIDHTGHLTEVPADTYEIVDIDGAGPNIVYMYLYGKLVGVDRNYVTIGAEVPAVGLLGGDLIPTGQCGDLRVDSVFVEYDDAYVDVTVVDRGDDRWDPDGLPAATGAEAYHFLTMTDGLRYRLRYQRDTSVTIKRES